MRVQRDQTVEFTDPDGDKLVLRAVVRQRDVLEVERVEQEEAMKALAMLKQAGISVEELAEREGQGEAEEAYAVREAKLKALAVRLIVGGEALGGQAIIDAYRDMDVASAKWVDARVKQVWEGSTLPDESARASAPVAHPA